MNLVEQVASGIPRMRDEMREAKLPEPIFLTEGGFFTVELKRPQKNISNPENGIVNSENGIVNPENGIVNSENGIVNLENGIENGIENLDDSIVKNGDIKDVLFTLITQQEGISTAELARLTGKSWRTTMRYLDVLKKENKIEFKGAPKIGGYYLKSLYH